MKPLIEELRPTSETTKTTPSGPDEMRQVIDEYANDLREILRKFRRKALN